jgi:RHS repeat-associated protein
LTEARSSGTTSYSYNAADELTAAGATTYTYDQNGNEKAAGSTTFSYDLANRLASTTGGGTTTTYSYDGDGNRRQAWTGSQASKKTNYLWDVSWGLPQLALERDGNNTLLRRYLYGQRRITMTAAGTAYYYHYDNVGSIANVTSAAGASEWTDVYEPFGAIRAETKNDTNAPPNFMKFAGEYADTTGLYYLRARQYDAGTGRLLQLDPAEPDQTVPSVSAYVYAADRPTVLTDPSGMTVTSSTAGLDAQLTVGTPAAYGVGEVNIDYPHFSITAYRRGVYEYVVTAWWSKISGPGSTATLTVKLQWQPSTGGWLNMGVPTRLSVPPGPRNKVVAAAACTPGTSRRLRGAVDFDMDGYPDPPGWQYGFVRKDVKCGV